MSNCSAGPAQTEQHDFTLRRPLLRWQTCFSSLPNGDCSALRKRRAAHRRVAILRPRHDFQMATAGVWREPCCCCCCCCLLACSLLPSFRAHYSGANDPSNDSLTSRTANGRCIEPGPHLPAIWKHRAATRCPTIDLATPPLWLDVGK